MRVQEIYPFLWTLIKWMKSTTVCRVAWRTLAAALREREGGLDMPALLIHVSFVTDWMTEWLSDGRTEQCLQYYLLSHPQPARLLRLPPHIPPPASS